MDTALSKLPGVSPISIELDEGTRVSPGTTITGHVVMSRPLSKDAESFTVSLFGETHTFLQAGAYFKTEQRDIFLSQSIDLLGPASGVSSNLKYPFAFELPADSPPSLRITRYSFLAYTIKAVIIRKGLHLDYTATVPLTVLVSKPVSRSTYNIHRAILMIHLSPGEKLAPIELTGEDVPPPYPTHENCVDYSAMPAMPGAEPETEPVDENGLAVTSVSSLQREKQDYTVDVQSVNGSVYSNDAEFTKDIPSHNGATHSSPSLPSSSSSPSSSNVYRMSLDVYYPDGGVYTTQKIPVKLVLRINSPVPKLTIVGIRIALLEETSINTDGHIHTERADHLLVDNKDQIPIYDKHVLDLSYLLTNCELPESLVPSFNCNALGRKYGLMIMLQVTKNSGLDQVIKHRLVTRTPLKILGKYIAA